MNTANLFHNEALATQLTPRETIVLLAAQKNKPVSDIAAMLGTSDQIVIRHICNIVSKLNYSDCALAYQLCISYKLEKYHNL